MKSQKNNSKYIYHDDTDKSTDSSRFIQSVRKFFLSSNRKPNWLTVKGGEQ